MTSERRAQVAKKEMVLCDIEYSERFPSIILLRRHLAKKMQVRPQPKTMAMIIERYKNCAFVEITGKENIEKYGSTMTVYYDCMEPVIKQEKIKL